MKIDKYYLISGIILLVLSVLTSIGFHAIGFSENWNLVYIGIIAFICAFLISIVKPMEKPCNPR